MTRRRDGQHLTPLQALHRLWDVGIHQVSPGTLGMVMAGYALIEPEARMLTSDIPGIRWLDGWIVRGKYEGSYGSERPPT